MGCQHLGLRDWAAQCSSRRASHGNSTAGDNFPISSSLPVAGCWLPLLLLDSSSHANLVSAYTDSSGYVLHQQNMQREVQRSKCALQAMSFLMQMPLMQCHNLRHHRCPNHFSPK